MKKVLFLVSSFCFLSVSTSLAQKTEIKKVEKVNKIESTTVKPAEKTTQTEKSEVKLTPANKTVEAKNIKTTKPMKVSQAQQSVVPAKKREEKKEIGE